MHSPAEFTLYGRSDSRYVEAERLSYRAHPKQGFASRRSLVL